MDSKTRAQLEKAKAYYYAAKLPECYAILRRYFDRLPFAPEPEHAEYIAMFCRLLIDLKRDFDLNFYIRELERQQEKVPSAHLKYALAVAYFYGPEPRFDQVRRMLEEVVRENCSPTVRERAKMLLAVYYYERDPGACNCVVDSFEATDDVGLNRLQALWRAVVLRRARRFEEAKNLIDQMLAGHSGDPDWYSRFSAMIIQGRIAVDTAQIEDAEAIYAEVRAATFECGLRTSLEDQLQGLRTAIDQSKSSGMVTLDIRDNEIAFQYGKKRVLISDTQPAERLLLLLAKKRKVDKEQIVRSLYGRGYCAEDDKLIYYHIHALRRKLKEFGLPAETIQTEKNGYSWTTEVNWKQEEQ